jgi:antitoxin VapB
MTAARRVKLFKNGRSQAVRIPAEFRFSGTEVLMSREGDLLVLKPLGRRTSAWHELLFGAGQTDFPEREQPPLQRRRFK